MNAGLAAKILALLPQTQCTRCGYPDCAAYAQSIADGTATINQCPPGGAQGVQWLAAATGLPPSALNPDNGVEGPRTVAFIDEDWCIGCTLCIDACPTDAIVGSNKLMHTVIEAYCTGCELCLPVCPVDCILLENVTGTKTGWAAWSQEQADLARRRYETGQIRRKLGKVKTDDRLENTDPATLDKKRASIEAALKRARAKREPGQSAA